MPDCVESPATRPATADRASVTTLAHGIEYCGRGDFPNILYVDAVGLWYGEKLWRHPWSSDQGKPPSIDL